MKQILRLGEGYVLSAIKRYFLYTLLISLCIILLPNSFARAQSASTKNLGIPEGGLKIGNTIPEALWNLPLQVANHPEGKETITLNDYRGKLIILDFWATWCTACLHNFPLLDSLEGMFTGRVVTIKITQEAPEQLKKPWYSVVGDSLLNNAFPHRLIPHYVWIAPNGQVAAYTATEQLTAAYMEQLLAGGTATMLLKRDRDPDKPLFLDPALEGAGMRYYAALLRGRQSGVASASLFRKTGELVTGRALTNRQLYDLFLATARPLFEQLGDMYTRQRLLLDVRDSSGLFIDFKEPIAEEQLYSYDISVPPQAADSLYRYMLADLNRYTAYNGAIEYRAMECLVLTVDGTDDKLASKGEAPRTQLRRGSEIRISNRPLATLVYFLNSSGGLPMLIKDETGYRGSIDLALPAITGVEGLRESLRAYGLRLEEAERRVPMLVIREKMNQPE